MQRVGVCLSTTILILKVLLFSTVDAYAQNATMTIGSGCTVHVKADELPPGRLVLSCSRHYVAMVDGMPHDTHDPSRDGTRCVYGYWRAPSLLRWRSGGPDRGRSVHPGGPGPDHGAGPGRPGRQGPAGP